MTRMWIGLAAAATLSACALVDSIGDEGEDSPPPLPPPCPIGDPDCGFPEPQPDSQATCGDPLLLGTPEIAQTISTCGQDQTGASVCAPVAGGDMILQFRIDEPASYELCATIPDDSFVSLTAGPCRDDGDSPGNIATCLPGTGCDTFGFDPGIYFLHWQGGDSSDPSSPDCADLVLTLRKISNAAGEDPLYERRTR